MLKTIAILCGIATSASAVTLVHYDFDDDTTAPSQVAASVSASGFTLHTASGELSPNLYNQGSGKAVGHNGWNVADGQKWWSLTLTADVGMTLGLGSLEFKDRATTAGADDWSLFINDVAVTSGAASKVSSGNLGNQLIDLSPFAASFANIESAEFKLFGFGDGSAGGTWRLDDVKIDGELVHKVVKTPDATAVPESLGSLATAFALLPLAVGALLRHRRFGERAC